tara:strand:+ start:18677 stop:19558 length:882 start_codon:yes stop_codon:yes gene_type:complete
MYSILIAGANGVIGSYLCEKLNQDFNIIPISKNPNTVDISKVDLCDKDSIKNFFKKDQNFDCLIFLAGRAHKKSRNKDLQKYEDSNFITLKNLLITLDQLHMTPKKVIFASTISVYGENYCKSEYYENSELNPISSYAKTKIKAEKFLLDNFKSVSWILRLSPVYSDSFMLNITRRIKLGNFFFKIGNGKAKFSLCNIINIEEVVRAIIHNNVPLGIYNISDPKNYTYIDLLKYCKVRKFIRIPSFVAGFTYIVSILTRNIYYKESSIKLLTNNIFPSTKIDKYVKLKNYLHK